MALFKYLRHRLNSLTRRVVGNVRHLPSASLKSSRQARLAVEELEGRVVLSHGGILSRVNMSPVPAVVDDPPSTVENPIWTNNPATDITRARGSQGDGHCGSRGGKHQGTDLLADEGASVHAVQEGVVDRVVSAGPGSRTGS